MLEKFGDWFKKYNTEFTWFLIGWLCMAGLDQVSRGQYVMAMIDVGLAYWNYSMWRDSNV